MPSPWTLLDAVETDEGLLELRRRGERDFLIQVDRRVLMSSVHTRSEEALATLGCAAASERPEPRVLLGGLGLGYTLRAALDALPPGARVRVVELPPVVVQWCRGPAAPVSGAALDDPRVEVVVDDVAAQIHRVASDPSAARFDAILLDLYVGPGPIPRGRSDPHYGPESVRRAREALAPGGVYAVWGEDLDRGFERRLRDAGFGVRVQQVRGGGPTHVVYLATRPA